MCVVDEPVEDCVGDDGVGDQVVPSGHRYQSGDDCRFDPIAFLDDFEQVETLLVDQRMRCGVIQAEKRYAGELVEQLQKAAIETGERSSMMLAASAPTTDRNMNRGTVTILQKRKAAIHTKIAITLFARPDKRPLAASIIPLRGRPITEVWTVDLPAFKPADVFDYSFHVPRAKFIDLAFVIIQV